MVRISGGKVTGNRLQVTGERLQVTGDRSQTAATQNRTCGSAGHLGGRGANLLLSNRGHEKKVID